MTIDQPRTLVVAHNPFNRERNNSITMSNLFSGWRPDSLAQVFMPFLTPIAPDFEIAGAYWALTPGRALVARMGRPRSGVVRHRGTAAGIPGTSDSLPRRLLGRAARIEGVFSLAASTREAMYAVAPLPDALLEEWVTAFSPDVIYSTLGSLHCARLARALGARCGVPVIPHFTDDWMATLYRSGVGHSLLRRALDREMSALFAQAPVSLTISDMMSDEYTARYGGRFETFGNSVDSGRYSPRERPRDARPLVLSYIGGLHLGRWRSLRDIAAALTTAGIDVRLRVYTFPSDTAMYGRELSASPAIELMGWIPNAMVPDAIASADVMVHVERFDATVAEYTRFSISTKIAEYLMSGRPVLAYGPAELASIQYLARTGAAVIATQPDRALLAECVARLLNEPDERHRLGKAARALALEHHDIHRQRVRFATLMQHAARSLRPQAS